MTGLNR